MNKIYILTGGTFNHISPHFSLAAPAYGQVGEDLYKTLKHTPKAEVHLIKTKMAENTVTHPVILAAGLKKLETNDELKVLLSYLSSLDDTKAIILSCAVTDFTINLEQETPQRLDSSQRLNVTLVPSEKLLPLIREDIYTVSFKTLYGADSEVAGIKAVKNLNSSDVILVNDIKTRKNGVASEKGIVWTETRAEALRIVCFHIWRELGVDNRKCYGCGMQRPVDFKEFINARTCECGSKRCTVMSYGTILSYKYKL